MTHRPNLTTLLLITLLSIGQAHACPKGTIKDIQVNAIESLTPQAGNVVILDVRTPEEYTAGHIQNALNIDIRNDTFAEEVAKLDRNNTYIVHCAANVENGRTEKSLKIMSDLGFTKLRNMAGGIVAWQADGLPLEMP